MITTKFQSAGTTSWTCPANVYNIQVECWGGGGGGRNGGGSPGGGDTSTQGGGGGAYAKLLELEVIPGTAYDVVVGAGGECPGAYYERANGLPGGNSYFASGADCKADAGNGGGDGATTNEGLASASVGDTKYNGGRGSFTDQGAGGGAGGPDVAGGDASGETGGTGDNGSGGAGGTSNNDGGDSELGGGGGGGSTNDGVGGHGGNYGGGGGAGESDGDDGGRGQIILQYEFEYRGGGFLNNLI